MVYFEFMLVISHLGDYQLPAGAHPVIPSDCDDLIVAIEALVIYYWGVCSALNVLEIDTDDQEVLAVRAAEV